MRTRKLFIVGPHREERYILFKEYIYRTLMLRADWKSVTYKVLTPIDNNRSDDFNDWIFGQIDTCDLIVADMTGFNPNVIYEVAFAHSLGVPCVYLRFDLSTVEEADGNGQDTKRMESTDQDKIEHYFKLSLIPSVTAEELKNGQNESFDRQLNAAISGDISIGKTILTNYYGGVAPIDAEFVRGLAEGYYRNFLRRLLACEPPEGFKGVSFRVLIPDTFTVKDSEIRRKVEEVLGSGSRELSSNTLKRALRVSHTEKKTGKQLAMPEDQFFFDIPTTLLTITESYKYKKVFKGKHSGETYFDDLDRDRLTDRLARRFTSMLWELIENDPAHIEWPVDQFEIVWLSDAIGPWLKNKDLLNLEPLDRPS